jgi:hypothetical protein
MKPLVHFMEVTLSLDIVSFREFMLFNQMETLGNVQYVNQFNNTLSLQICTHNLINCVCCYTLNAQHLNHNSYNINKPLN